MFYDEVPMKTIYGLVDPRDNKLRYVGQTKNLKTRFSQHCSDLTGVSPKEIWIKELQVLGLTPIIKEFEEVEDHEARLVEKTYIELYLILGVKLTNYEAR
jgi:hypothetical protein